MKENQEHLNRQLISAFNARNIESFEKALKKGADINCEYKYKNGGLIIEAIETTNTESVKLLTKYGAKVNFHANDRMWNIYRDLLVSDMYRSARYINELRRLRYEIQDEKQCIKAQKSFDRKYKKSGFERDKIEIARELIIAGADINHAPFGHPIDFAVDDGGYIKYLDLLLVLLIAYEVNWDRVDENIRDAGPVKSWNYLASLIKSSDRFKDKGILYFIEVMLNRPKEMAKEFTPNLP